MASIICFLSLLLSALHASPVAADTLQLVAVSDNTLIESATGHVSGGLMPFFFAGDTDQGDSNNTRRGLLRFDLSAIPAGSIINIASLRLFMSKSAIAGPYDFTLHRVLADWGEGTTQGDGGTGGFSTPDSATWIHRFHATAFWSAIGGDFEAAASATFLVGLVGSYTWSSAALAVDVQHWLDAPQSNFGWMLKGVEGAGVSSKRFESREALIAADRPTLIVGFTPPLGCPADTNNDNVVNVTDLLAVISAWGACADINNCPPDVNGDDAVNVTDLLAVIGGWGVCP